MSKSHPLTKLQLLLAILGVLPFFILPNVEGSKQFIWFFVGIVPFIGLSIVTVYLGWLMVFKKEDVVYPFEIFGVQVAEKTRGKQAAKKSHGRIFQNKQKNVYRWCEYIFRFALLY